MSLYVDTSALLKLYLDEADSEECERLLLSDPGWITARHTEVEVRRNLARELDGRALAGARDQFRRDWESMAVVELDEATCRLAAEIAEVTGARSLDALHLGAARRVGGDQIPFVTHDLRQAQVARSLGWTVLGV
ncbi:MAG: type II toxin-antitoxin system VapC family toxin [Actinomycetota bacterium]